MSWAVFYLGLGLNRLGWGVEKTGAKIMAWAAARLNRQAVA